MLKALDKIGGYDKINPSRDGSDFGELWAPIFDEFKNRMVISLTGMGDYYVNNPYIPLLKTEYEEKLDKIIKNENDRLLDIQHKKADMNDMLITRRIAYVSIAISIAGIIIAILAATVWR